MVSYDIVVNGTPCSQCPTPVSNGRFGQALQFSSTGDMLTVQSGTAAPLGNEVTLSAWLRPDSVGGVQRLITLGNGAGGLYVSIFGELVFFLLIDGEPYQVDVPGLLTAGEWQHVVGAYDGQTMRLYHNGIEVSAMAVAGELDQTAAPLSIMFLGGAAEPYDGQMDEIVIYGRALSGAEIYALAQVEAAGVQNVAVGLEIFDFAETFPQPQIAWFAAAVDNGSWSYTVAGDYEGLYNIHLRATDNFGNVTMRGVVWRGLLDTAPPVISGTMQYVDDGQPETEYSFTFSDFILDSASFDQPCDAGDLQILSYDGSIDDVILPHDGLPFEVSATCRVPGHESGRDLTACDSAGHCATLTLGDPTAITLHTWRAAPVQQPDFRLFFMLLLALFSTQVVWLFWRRRERRG